MKFIAAASALALLMAQVNAKPAEGCLLNHTSKLFYFWGAMFRSLISFFFFFSKIHHLVTATDSCTSVAAQFQITEADFYTMVRNALIYIIIFFIFKKKKEKSKIIELNW
jgi:hypothetical protein